MYSPFLRPTLRAALASPSNSVGCSRAEQTGHSILRARFWGVGSKGWTPNVFSAIRLSTVRHKEPPDYVDESSEEPESAQAPSPGWGTRIGFYRVALGLHSHEALAEALGVVADTVGRWESEIQEPHTSSLLRLAVLSTTPEVAYRYLTQGGDLPSELVYRRIRPPGEGGTA